MCMYICIYTCIYIYVCIYILIDWIRVFLTIKLFLSPTSNRLRHTISHITGSWALWLPWPPDIWTLSILTLHTKQSLDSLFKATKEKKNGTRYNSLNNYFVYSSVQLLSHLSHLSNKGQVLQVIQGQTQRSRVLSISEWVATLVSISWHLKPLNHKNVWYCLWYSFKMVAFLFNVIIMVLWFWSLSYFIYLNDF